MKKQVKKIIICLLLTICCLCGALIGATNNVLYAVSNATKYTNVLYDLQTDENFDASEYVVDNTDYSLQVIQIAESNEKELFVYTYQPYTLDNNLKATSINISQGIDENLHYRNYTLTLLSSNGVFHKYKVDNFRIEDTATRYYDISSIFRKWYAEIDESPDNDNTISEVSFTVGKRFIAYTSDNEIFYDCITSETILITDKFVGTIQYFDGFDMVFALSNTDSHFVAFNTDLPIDRLIEADVIYTSRPYTQYGLTIFWHFLVLPIGTDYGTYSSNSVSLNYTQKVSTDTYGLFGSSYSWERIQSVDTFLDTENVSEECENALSNMKWVLRFAETSCVETMTNVSTVSGTEITDVSILRLKFETNGVVYNLGVIDNKQSGSGVYVNKVNTMEDFLKMIFGIILLIILIIILAPFMPAIFNFIVWLFTGIWHIISAPFKAIKKNKNRNKKGGGKK